MSTEPSEKPRTPRYPYAPEYWKVLFRDPWSRENEFIRVDTVTQSIEELVELQRALLAMVNCEDDYRLGKLAIISPMLNNASHITSWLGKYVEYLKTGIVPDSYYVK